MAANPTPPADSINRLTELAIKVLKPGGVSVGGMLGLWFWLAKSDLGAAIASTLIGFCFSYAGKVWEPIHQGNQRRFQGVGQVIDSSIDDGLAQLLATATRAEDAYLICQALDCRDYKPEGMGARDRIFFPMLHEVFVPLELDTSSMPPGYCQLPENLQDLGIWPFLARAKQEPAYRQLAIVAWGGFGKTTLLKHLAYTYGTRQQDPGVPSLVPILLPLRNYRVQLTGDNPPDLPQLITDYHLKSLAELDSRLNKLPPG